MPNPHNGADDTNELEGVNIDDGTTDDTGARRDKSEVSPSADEGNDAS